MSLDRMKSHVSPEAQASQVKQNMRPAYPPSFGLDFLILEGLGSWSRHRFKAHRMQL